MIRQATRADLAALVQMAGRFHAAVPHTRAIAFSPISAAAAFGQALANPRNVVLVLDIAGPRGVFVAEEVDCPFGAAILAKESLFWIDADYRGRWGIRLLQAYEDWARGRNIKIIGMTCFQDGRTHKLIERLGFVAIETNFVKEL